jgi:hypothetical protein
VRPVTHSPPAPSRLFYWHCHRSSQRHLRLFGNRWGHAISTFGEAGDLVRWTEVECSAIRGGSGAILPVPEKMQAAVGDGTKAIAFGGIADGIAFWTTSDPDQVCCWQPPHGCVDTGPPNGSYTCNKTALHPNRPSRSMLPDGIVAGASMGDPTAAWYNSTDGKLYGVFASSEQCSNCTWRNPGKYQSLLFRTTTDSDWRDWEFISVFWRCGKRPVLSQLFAIYNHIHVNLP